MRAVAAARHSLRGGVGSTWTPIPRASTSGSQRSTNSRSRAWTITGLSHTGRAAATRKRGKMAMIGRERESTAEGQEPQKEQREQEQPAVIASIVEAAKR
jgi:hypothetical protein